MSQQKIFMERLFTLGQKFGCDKVLSHSYEYPYAKHFHTLEKQNIKILEIGVGGENYALGGQSLKLWYELFPNAVIYAIDLYDKSVLNNERTHTYIVDQRDQKTLIEFATEYGPFDIIIDDGSHKREDVLLSLFALITHIKPNGYYVIEDISTSYWPVYDGSSLAKDFIDTPIHWVKNLIDVVHKKDILGNYKLPTWDILGVSVYSGIAFIEVGESRIPSNLPPANDFVSNQSELDELRYGMYRENIDAFAQNPMQLITAKFTK